MRPPYGPPDPVSVRADGLSTGYEGDRGWRRSIYLRQLRMNSPTTLDLFDYPTMNPNCTERAQSTVAPQALHLLNDATIRRLASALAQRGGFRGRRQPGSPGWNIFIGGCSAAAYW